MPDIKTKKSIFTRLRNYFLTGVVVLIPLGITLYLTLFIIKISSNLLPKEINPNNYLPFDIIGLEILIAIVLITFICLWVSSLLLGENKYEMINLLLNSSIGKFIILSVTWSFSFQVLSEIRHLIMDFGYGFDLKTTKITGLIVIFGSIILTIILYLIGKNFI